MVFFSCPVFEGLNELSIKADISTRLTSLKPEVSPYAAWLVRRGVVRKTSDISKTRGNFAGRSMSNLFEAITDRMSG